MSTLTSSPPPADGFVMLAAIHSSNVEIPEHQMVFWHASTFFLSSSSYIIKRILNKLIISKHILIICHMDRQCNNNISGKALSTSA